MAETPERKKTSFEWNEGRLSANFADGSKHSALFPFWDRVPEDLRPLVQYGITQMVSDYAAGEKLPVAKANLMRERMNSIVAGEFGTGPTLQDIGNAFVLLGKVKKADEAIAKWQAKTKEERETLLKVEAVQTAIKAAQADRRAAAARAALKDAKPVDL